MKKKTTKYYYRLPIETEAGKKLKEILDKGQEAWEAAAGLVKKLGAARFTTNGAFLIGGIGKLYFEHKPNQRAYDVLRRYKNYYECIPNRGRHAGHNIMQEILDLPTVKFSELRPVFGEQKTGWITPAFFDYLDDIYISSSNELAVEGMVESNEAVWAAMKEAKRITSTEE